MYTLGLVLLTAKPDSVPPVLVMSVASKPTGTSEKVNFSVALSPIFRLVVLALIVKLGALVSVAVVLKLRLGLALPPAWFPAASV